MRWKSGEGAKAEDGKDKATKASDDKGKAPEEKGKAPAGDKGKGAAKEKETKKK